ncbi:MAG: menaquinone biosynthesis protein [Chthoniobacterales bacterium]
MSARDPHAVRVGCVQYLNAQPLIHGWPGQVAFDHPAALCQQLAAGELDVACVSSFEYLRDPTLSIVDGVSVAADGAVHSVFVAHRGPFEEIEAIALDPASCTSVNLLRVLLAERGLSPRIADASSFSGPHARLLIGDQAIRFREKHGAQFDYWDLGAEWKRATGLPFVFALWLIRSEVDDASAIAEAIRARRDANLQALEEVIAAQRDFSADFCKFYLRECLCFGFADREKAGLLRFRALCENNGLLPPSTSPLHLA